MIQIDSNRAVESINFQQLTFQAIGDPEQEDVGYNYGFNSVKGRFEETCRTLHRLKSREVTDVYKAYHSKVDQAKAEVTLPRLADPTKKYIDMFDSLLYPKQMMPIDINSTTIQYKDDDGNTRQFSELSSGEREVVILIFDLLTHNPSDCLVLIDEPEVHLHPELAFRLIKALKSIGENNQYFLFTHSADIIGSALDSGVHFIRPKVRVPQGNQVIRIDESNFEAFKTIPNIRETIGMISVGKKLLFVEGTSGSIDRNVFATLAKANKKDVAIIPSESCSNINNMALMCQTLERGLMGVDLFMARDRDGLTEQQVNNFHQKSNGRLMFLPYYHIENVFLHPEAIGAIAKKILLSTAPSVDEIQARMVDLAKQQLTYAASLYVKSEIYFSAGNFDISPSLQINGQTELHQIANDMAVKRDALIAKYTSDFGNERIQERLMHWNQVLSNSISSGWSEDARRFFIGKRLLKDVQGWLFGSRKISLWEHVVNSESPECIDACTGLTAILNRV